MAKKVHPSPESTHLAQLLQVNDKVNDESKEYSVLKNMFVYGGRS